jgi:hypothetical protein
MRSLAGRFTHRAVSSLVLFLALASVVDGGSSLAYCSSCGELDALEAAVIDAGWSSIAAGGVGLANDAHVTAKPLGTLSLPSGSFAAGAVSLLGESECSSGSCGLLAGSPLGATAGTSWLIATSSNDCSGTPPCLLRRCLLRPDLDKKPSWAHPGTGHLSSGAGFSASGPADTGVVGTRLWLRAEIA